MKRKPNLLRNPMARELSLSLYRKKVVKSKKTYDRKQIARTRHPGDLFFESILNKSSDMIASRSISLKYDLRRLHWQN